MPRSPITTRCSSCRRMQARPRTPCCGAGTLLIEAASVGAAVSGSDSNWHMVAAARENLAHFGIQASVSFARAEDVTGQFDVVITDLPYGRSAPADEDLYRRVLANTAGLAPRAAVFLGQAAEDIIRAAGYDVEVALTPGPDAAHFMPTAKMLMLKLVADRKTRRLLGAQAVGPGAGDKRIDVATMALTAGMTVDQLAHVDLCYAPPYAPAMDNILTAADVLRNKLDNLFKGMSAEALRDACASDRPPVLLDVRTPGEFEEMRLPGSLFIPLGALRGRLKEVPRDRPIVCFCKISLRGYEAARILQGAGYGDVRVLDGGLVMWPYALER